MTAQPDVSTKVWTIPNLISFVRLMAIPLFLWLVAEGRDLEGLVVLVVAVLTDFVDGAVARKLNQVSRLGQFLDPFADRLFIAAAVVALAIRDVIPVWLTVVVMLRDALLGLGALVTSRWGIGTLPVTWLGKVATFGLLFAMPLFLLGAVFPELGVYTNPVAWVISISGAALYWWVGFGYLFEAIRVVRLSSREALDPSATL